MGWSKPSSLRERGVAVPMPSGLAHDPHMQRGLGGPRVLWREARPTAEAVAAWPVADTGGRGKNPRIPGVQVAETVIQTPITQYSAGTLR